MPDRVLRLASLAAACAMLGAAPPPTFAATPPGTPLSPGAAAASAVEAERATVEFYRWYLHRLKLDHDPIRDDVEALAERASTALLREIRAKMASPAGIEGDYFLQDQDYADDWLDHVEARYVRFDGSAASVGVDLGSGDPSTRRLTVTLVRENARWKIRRVVIAR